MPKSRMDVVHEVTNALLLKFNAELIKCTDNGFITTARMRTDDKLIDIKVETHDLGIKNDRSPGGTGKAVGKDSIR